MTNKDKLEKLKKLADAMYYAAQQLTTDASRLHKAMDEYHKFIIHECKDEPKECMYSKDNYTDEDRKVLCDGCEEECRFNKKEDSVSEQNLSNVKRTGKNWKESVSENLGEAAEDFSKSTLVGSPYIKKNAFKAGANWQKEQLLAKAVDGVVHHFEKCGVASVHYTDPTGVPMAYFTFPEGLSAGDKVKIIVIKEG